MSRFAAGVLLASLASAMLLALTLFCFGQHKLALGAVLGGFWGILYFFQLQRDVGRFETAKFSAIRRLLFVTAGLILFLKLGFQVFWGALIGFFLYKPAIVLLLLLGMKD